MKDDKKDDKYAVILAAVIEAAKDGGEAAVRSDDTFEKGQALAYFHIITAVLENAEMVGVEAEELGLANYNPEAMLKAG